MRKFIKLAWRNLWRNRRRSVITIAAIAFAILMTAITRSLQYGTYDTMESLAVRLYHGEIQIQNEKFHDEQTLNYFLQEDAYDWQALVRETPDLTGFTRRITGFGLASSDSGSTGALIVGIEPERERQITRFSVALQSGHRLQKGDDRQILIGRTLAKNLQLSVGDTCVVLTQGYRNQLGADKYVVKGTVSMGQAELDRAIMIMLLPNAQELFSLYNGITQVVFRTTDFRQAEAIAQSLSRHLSDENLAVLSWKELMPELQQIITVDNVSGAIYLAFILIVVGIEIFNATMMSIIERTREFGVMQSIGMKPRQISGLILLESLQKVSVALLGGLLISILAVSILAQYNIPLPADMVKAYADYGFVIDEMKFSQRLRVYSEPILSIALIALIAVSFPIFRISKLSPVEAFRKT